MRSRLQRRARDERGVVLVLVAVLIVAMLALAAFVVDVESWNQVQRQAQAAADAGALAGARDLPCSVGAPTCATADATTYAQANLPGVTPIVTYPTSAQVKVTETKVAPSFFGKLLGINFATVSASAVAQANGTSAPDGLFAYNSACNPGSAGITISVNNVDITGAVISNGSFSDTANNSTLGPTTYVGASSCSSVSANSATFTSGPTSATGQSYPLDYSQRLATLCPSFTSGNSPSSWAFANTLTIAPGIYCYSGNITIAANNVTATGVTLIGKTVSITANNVTISPAVGAGTLAIYQTIGGWNATTGTCSSTSSSISSSANNESITGDIFAPCSTIDVSTNNNTANFFEGYNIDLTSNNVAFTGDGPSSGGGASGDSLVQ